jgi:hypothetical protein
LCDKKLHKDEYMSNKDLEDLRFCMTSKKFLVVVDGVSSIENLETMQLFVSRIPKVIAKAKYL